MTKLSRDQLYQYGKQAGFTGAALDEVVAIAFAESAGDTQHQNVNHAQLTVNGTTYPFSTDRGVLQINREWNPDVSDACAFDPVCSFAWAYKVTGGRQPAPGADPFKAYWVTVQQGQYKQFLTPGYQPGSTSSSTTGGSTSTSSSNPVVAGAVSGATGTTTTNTEPLGAILSGATSSATGTTTPDLTSIQSGLSSVTSSISSLSSTVGSAIQQANNIQQATPSALIRIGLFALLLILLIAGFGLVANSKEL